ncbi:MFS transporter [Elizabethkingia anophelis]|nr:MFS transporter [Elizabethkingia anophelis]MCT3732683.1 MFS transporter [Elizabethkingia anophelis]
MGIKESLAGQWITLYALGSVLAAIPIIAVTLHWSRKRLLLLAITGFFIFNAITALSSSYILTLVARFIAGMAAGVTWGLLIGYSKRMVSEDIQGRTIAMVGLGQPIALAAGVPLVVWLGKIFGWNGAFAIMSVISFLLIIWIATSLPDIKGVKPEKKVSVYRIFMLNGIRQLLLIMFLWILAHNILYTYISPFLSNFGLSHKVDLLLLIFGLASLSGIIITGFLIDNLPKCTTGIIYKNILFNIILIISQNSPRRLGCPIIILCKIVTSLHHKILCTSKYLDL